MLLAPSVPLGRIARNESADCVGLKSFHLKVE